jgi:hypothetical protein
MSHHYSGPDWGFPRGDLTDLYTFPKPGDAGKSILVMNVHPSAHDYLDRENPLGATTAEERPRTRKNCRGRAPRSAWIQPPSEPACGATGQLLCPPKAKLGRAPHRSIFLRQKGCRKQLAVHRGRFLRRQGCVQHRDQVGPHGDLLAESHTWGRRTTAERKRTVSAVRDQKPLPARRK